LKKTASILLLGILMFNLFGYRLLVVYMQHEADQELETRLDSESFDESTLFSIKVPVTQLSYYNVSTQFERVDGSIEIHGVTYTYVKRRLFNDSLEMLCIPNQTANSLRAFKNEFFSSVNGFQQATSGKRQGAYPLPYKFPPFDPCTDPSPDGGHEPPFRQLATYFHYSTRMTSVNLGTDEKPPSSPGV
jgi:hypothetical protein